MAEKTVLSEFICKDDFVDDFESDFEYINPMIGSQEHVHPLPPSVPHPPHNFAHIEWGHDAFKRRMSMSSSDGSPDGPMFSSFSDSFDSPEHTMGSSYGSMSRVESFNASDKALQSQDATFHGMPFDDEHIFSELDHHMSQFNEDPRLTVETWRRSELMSPFGILGQRNLNLSLVRPVFPENRTHASAPDANQMVWSLVEHIPSQLPKTIAPSNTYHMPSTPPSMCKGEPQLGDDNLDLKTYLCKPSPNVHARAGCPSPPVLPSQPDIDFPMILDVSSDGEDLEPFVVVRRRTGRCPAVRPRRHVASVRRAPREERRPPRRPNFEVAPANTLHCRYPGCPRAFIRSEHRKRHELSIHDRANQPEYPCWVPGCRTSAFSRSDNLKAHLNNTHSKKSPRQRNRYVATLDCESEYYDPQWIGDLTEDGFPILSREKPEETSE